MHLQLAGKNICLIGGTKGIGLALLKTLAAEKANLLIVARQPQAITALMEAHATHQNTTITAVAVDITTPDAASQIAEKAGALFTKLHGVVFLNHAAVTKQPFSASDETESGSGHLKISCCARPPLA